MTRKLSAAAVVLGLAVVWFGGPGSSARQQAAEYAPGELLVAFAPNVDSAGRAAIASSRGLTIAERFQEVGVDRLLTSSGQDPLAMAAQLSSSPGVIGAQPNFLRQRVAPPPPNDPFWLNGSLWGMERIQAQGVWVNYTTGSPAIIIADVDTGVNYLHPDLAANMWQNPLEIPGNGIDDDANGYVDDVYGIDTHNDDSDPIDDDGHGTHTSGTIAGVGNNGAGVAGVTWNSKILACKFLDENGNGFDSDAIACFNYILALKNRGENIRVTNNSWGHIRGSFPFAMQAAIDALGNAGILNVFAAGNNGTNNDVTPFDPASIPSASIVSVAASNNDAGDTRASFSNYGLTSVDLAAPGVGIVSTYLGTGYASSNGTSMAAPHVAGAAALLLALDGNLSVSALKTLLMSSVDPRPAWSGLVASGGRLNVLTAAQAIGNVPPTVAITSPPDGSGFTAPATIAIAADAADSDGNVTLVEFFANGALIGSDGSAPYTFNWTNVPAGAYALTARATDNDGATTTSSPVDVTVAPPGGGASATFVTADNTTQGNWIGTYGGDGYAIVGDQTSLPGYATLTTANALSYTWHGNPGEVRALQRVSGGRIAATWYETGTTFDLNVNLTDGQPHEVALYGLDWDTTSRSQRVDVLDAGTNAVLDSRTMSGFSGGRYLVWIVTGNVKFRVTRLGGLNAVISAVFFDAAAGGGNQPPTAAITSPTEGTTYTAPATIPIAANASDSDGSVTLVEFFANGTLIGSDSTAPYTFNWTNVNQGTYALMARATDDDGAQTTSAPVNVTVDPPGGGNLPPTAAITSPTEGTTYTAPATIPIAANAADSDGSVTLVEFFANGTLIGSDSTAPYTFNWTSVNQGTYALTARATDDDGAQTTSAPVNVTVNPPGGGGASATFVTADNTTQGNWIGTYGGDGYAIVGDQTSLPGYASLTSSNALTFTWHGNPGEQRALRRADGSGRVAATWYEVGTTFDLHLNLNDGQPHEVALYVLDWDTTSRFQRVDVLDAATDAVLDTRTMSGFNGGRYMVWTVSGNVKFRVTRLGGLNAVVSAVFLGPASEANRPDLPSGVR